MVNLYIQKLMIQEKWYYEQDNHSILKRFYSYNKNKLYNNTILTLYLINPCF